MRTVFRLSEAETKELSEKLKIGTFDVLPHLHGLCRSDDVCVVHQSVYNSIVKHPSFPWTWKRYDILQVPGKNIVYISDGKWLVADSEYPEGTV
jgi:hypothetical protein